MNEGDLVSLMDAVLDVDEVRAVDEGRSALRDSPRPPRARSLWGCATAALASAAVLVAAVLLWPKDPVAVERLQAAPILTRGESSGWRVDLRIAGSAYACVIVVDSHLEPWLLPGPQGAWTHVNEQVTLTIPEYANKPANSAGTRSKYLLIILSRSSSPTSADLMAAIPDPIDRSTSADELAAVIHVASDLESRFAVTAKLLPLGG